MSQLDQAKKEAKRLFNMAKASQGNEIVIENLSKSREILSVINGYKNWHEYEEVLKRKDFMLNVTDKNSENKNQKEIEKNLEYYIQELKFRKIINPNNNNYQKLIIDKPHKQIILGRKKSDKLFDNKEKKWILNEYPMLVVGSTGAGKTETLLSMLSQYIKNNEGFIYFDGKGDNMIYSKIFSYMQENNKLSNLYCLNFMLGSRDLLEESKNTEEKLSHSIDPINPMIGNENYFSYFFGRIGVVIHEILREINNQNQLMDIISLESCLMLNNLIKWNKENTFKTNAIKDYLIEIGVSDNDEDNDDDDFNNALLKHGLMCEKANKTISLFKSYPNIFRIDCSINMERIFLERKGLVVLLPALEKSTYEIANLGELIASQIRYIDEKYCRYNTHFQNIFFDEFTYFTEVLMNMNFKVTKNNYIFGMQDFNFNSQIMNYILMNTKTTLLMKSYDVDIHNKIKLDLLNLEQFPKLKTGNKKSFIRSFIQELNELREGEGYVLSKNFAINKMESIMNNEEKFYCEYLTCEYIPAKRTNKIWLEAQQKPIIYIGDINN